MAWQETLLDASFRGVRFDCETIADAAKRDVQRHAYPYVAGEDTEDLGRSSLDISVAAVFWGPDYEARLQAFINVIEQPGPGELVHPVFGSIPRAQVENWRIEHGAEQPDYARVSVQFCQSTAASGFFVRQLPEQQMAQARSIADTAYTAGVQAFARRVQTLTATRGTANRVNNLRTTLNRVLTAVHGLTKVPINRVLDVLDFPRAFTSDLAEGVRGLVDLRAFSATSLMPDWGGLAAAFNDAVRLPAGLVDGTLPATFRAESPVSPMATLALAPVDKTLVEAVIAVTVACELADTACTVLATEIRTPTLSPAEIETIVSDVRTGVQDAIDLHRTAYPIEVSRPVTEPLKDLAFAVQEAGIAVIDARPPLVRRTVDAPTNLHLLAFHWYGDYLRAAELARLNPGLRHPNFVYPGEMLHAWQR